MMFRIYKTKNGLVGDGEIRLFLSFLYFPCFVSLKVPISVSFFTLKLYRFACMLATGFRCFLASKSFSCASQFRFQHLNEQETYNNFKNFRLITF